MILGEPSIFAVESELGRAYQRLSFRAEGYFAVHIAGHCYGVRALDATMLGVTYDRVKNRIGRRGMHLAPFSEVPSGSLFADEYLAALYAPAQEPRPYLGMTPAEVADIVYAKGLMWAPDGSEAFDDGTHGVQFDVGNRVRLIAFKADEFYRHIPTTLVDTWVNADLFYNVLSSWINWFDFEWAARPKNTD